MVGWSGGWLHFGFAVTLLDQVETSLRPSCRGRLGGCENLVWAHFAEDAPKSPKSATSSLSGLGGFV